MFDYMDILDREIELIENDHSLTQAEKNKAIRELELEASEEAQRQAEHEEIDRRYGF